MIIFLGNGSTTDLYNDFIKTTSKDRDIVVSCQYVHRVPKSLIESHTCVNIHYGILPGFAGCNPIYWQLIKGDRAGVTLHYMNEEFDTGDVIDITEVDCSKMNAKQLYEELSLKGFEMFKKWYPQILDGTAPRKKQDPEKIEYYYKHEADFTSVCTNEREIRARFFPGKQYPKIEKDGVTYEIGGIEFGVQ